MTRGAEPVIVIIAFCSSVNFVRLLDGGILVGRSNFSSCKDLVLNGKSVTGSSYLSPILPSFYGALFNRHRNIRGSPNEQQGHSTLILGTPYVTLLPLI